MSDIGEIIGGLCILRNYDPWGSVSLSFERSLYAGPDIQDDNNPVTSVDQADLIRHGWQFDPAVMRWGWTK